MRKSKEIENSNFIYCSQRDCIHTECLRHNINTPWNVLILREKFKADKDWNCKDKIVEVNK